MPAVLGISPVCAGFVRVAGGSLVQSEPGKRFGELAGELMVNNKDKRLVLIEWEDSTQPVPAWQHRDEIKVAAVRISSVGWLIKDGKKVKALAPNVGGLDGKAAPQCSGVIAIPTRCVIRIHRLEERDD